MKKLWIGKRVSLVNYKMPGNFLKEKEGFIEYIFSNFFLFNEEDKLLAKLDIIDLGGIVFLKKGDFLSKNDYEMSKNDVLSFKTKPLFVFSSVDILNSFFFFFLSFIFWKSFIAFFDKIIAIKPKDGLKAEIFNLRTKNLSFNVKLFPSELKNILYILFLESDFVKFFRLFIFKTLKDPESLAAFFNISSKPEFFNKLSLELKLLFKNLSSNKVDLFEYFCILYKNSDFFEKTILYFIEYIYKFSQNWDKAQSTEEYYNFLTKSFFFSDISYKDIKLYNKIITISENKRETPEILVSCFLNKKQETNNDFIFHTTHEIFLI